MRSEQIRAALGFLQWDVDTLASKTGIGIDTLKEFLSVNGYLTMSGMSFAQQSAIITTFQLNGIAFNPKESDYGSAVMLLQSGGLGVITERFERAIKTFRNDLNTIMPDPTAAKAKLAEVIEKLKEAESAPEAE